MFEFIMWMIPIGLGWFALVWLFFKNIAEEECGHLGFIEFYKKMITGTISELKEDWNFWTKGWLR